MRLPALEDLTVGGRRFRSAVGGDVCAVRLCALERLTMGRMPSIQRMYVRHGRRGVAVCIRGRFRALTGGRDTEWIFGKPIPAPGFRVFPWHRCKRRCLLCSFRMPRPLSTTQECESSCDFAKIFRVSRYGS